MIGEEPIGRGERRPVRPRDAMSQMQRDRAAVGANAAVVRRRHGQREIGDHGAVCVEAKQMGEEQGVDFIGSGGVREHQIERVGVVLLPQAQYARDRRRP